MQSFTLSYILFTVSVSMIPSFEHTIPTTFLVSSEPTIAFAGAGIGAGKYAVTGSRGAASGTTKMTTITKGQQFDRFGGLHGKYITDVGTPKSALALPPANTGAKTTLQA